MVRSFTSKPLGRELVAELLSLSIRAPSAGNSGGASFLALDEPAAVEKFWNISLSTQKRLDFPWPNLLLAPVIILALTDSSCYARRYEEADKSGMQHPKDWQTPFWFVDTGFVIQNLLLAVTAKNEEGQNLGALFFGIFSSQPEIKLAFSIPSQQEIVGAVALGYIDKAGERPSKSLGREEPNKAIHFNSYSS